MRMGLLTIQSLRQKNNSCRLSLYYSCFIPLTIPNPLPHFPDAGKQSSINQLLRQSTTTATTVTATLLAHTFYLIGFKFIRP